MWVEEWEVKSTKSWAWKLSTEIISDHAWELSKDMQPSTTHTSKGVYAHDKEVIQVEDHGGRF